MCVMKPDPDSGTLSAMYFLDSTELAGPQRIVRVSNRSSVGVHRPANGTNAIGPMGTGNTKGKES
jgi:hypothetical protein